jgi:NADH dehydrogenase [ubiquinone] 1 alpha subcomplex assembly factor 7
MSLEKHIKKLISQTGAISVAQFMNEALSHPTHGYYHKQDPFGASGDFITAPEISQMFGELIGIWCASVLQSMGSKEFALVELGPGRGTLMKDLLRGTRHIPNFHKNLEVHMVETSPTLQQIQKDNLAESHENINWHNDLTSLPDMPMIVIANEFFDALPIHQYEKTKDGWRERMVGIDNAGELTFTYSNNIPLSSPPSAGGDGFKSIPIGGIIETCPQGINIARALSLKLAANTGAALIIDYGYGHYDYQDTLQAVKNHKYHPILKDVGDADITAHVDFCAIAEAATASDVNASDIITQNNLLLALGIKAREKVLLAKASEKQKLDITTATDRLINPEQMGTLFKAIALTNKELPRPVGF